MNALDQLKSIAIRPDLLYEFCENLIAQCKTKKLENQRLLKKLHKMERQVQSSENQALRFKRERDEMKLSRIRIQEYEPGEWRIINPYGHELSSYIDRDSIAFTKFTVFYWFTSGKGLRFTSEALAREAALLSPTWN